MRTSDLTGVQEEVETTIQWSVDNENAATINSEGTFKANAVTEKTIVTVTAQVEHPGTKAPITNTFQVTLKPYTYELLFTEGTKDTELDSKGITNFSVNLTRRSGVTNKVEDVETAIQWSVDNTSAASIDNKGKFEANAVTEKTVVKVTAKAKHPEKEGLFITKTLQVTLKPYTYELVFTEGTKDTLLNSKGTTNFSAKLTRKSGVTNKVEDVETAIQWSVDNTSAASIDNKGKFEAKSVSKETPVKVTAKAKHPEKEGLFITKTLQVTLKPYTYELVFTEGTKDTELNSEASTNFSANLTRKSGVTNKVEDVETAIQWSVDNTSAASIDNKGKFQAKSVSKETPVKVTAEVKHPDTNAAITKTFTVKVLRINERFILKGFNNREFLSIDMSYGKQVTVREITIENSIHGSIADELYASIKIEDDNNKIIYQKEWKSKDITNASNPNAIIPVKPGYFITFFHTEGGNRFVFRKSNYLGEFYDTGTLNTGLKSYRIKLREDGYNKV
nr:putative mucin/carbohydrate-binding domain-containing protein [Enterococcus rivorum]